MNRWQPITENEFKDLFNNQYKELSQEEQEKFEKYRVDFWRATIRRSESSGDEYVYVVAQHNDGVLYFDDVEYGFNISVVDDLGRVLKPGGSQNSLCEAIDEWF